jgi:hypothetical protein
LLVGIFAAFFHPGSPALLQQPEAGDILEQPDGLRDADFVREVGSERVTVDDRRVKL